MHDIGKLIHKVMQDRDYCLKSITVTWQINLTKNVIEYNEKTKQKRKQTIPIVFRMGKCVSRPSSPRTSPDERF